MPCGVVSEATMAATTALPMLPMLPAALADRQQQ
jgi:hypothetical protein